MGSKGSNTTTTTTAPNPSAMSAYQNILGRAQNVASQPYVPYGGELVSPVNQQQYAGIGNINQYSEVAQPTLGLAQNMAWNASQPITQAQIQQYQNPWTQAVINSTAAQFNNQNIQQLQNVRGNAIAQGALGGDREAVAESELANQQNLAQAPVIAGLESQGYTQGVNTALTEQQALASGAYSLGNLGVAAQNAGLGGAGAQIQAGGLEQQTQQALDAARLQQFMAQQAFPYQQTQWLAGIGSNIGSQMGGTSTTTGPAPSMLGQIAGIGTAAVGTLGGTGAFGSSGWLAPALSAMFVQRGGRVNGVASYDDGGAVASGGISPLPYASPGHAWEPYAGGRSWVPAVNMTHGQGLPRPPQPPQQPDPMKLGEQVAGLAKYFNTGRQPGSGLPAAGVGPGWAQPDSPLMTGYGPPQGVAPGIGPAGWAGTGSPLMTGYSGAYRHGGVVPGYADGGVPLPDDVDLPPAYQPSDVGPRGLVQDYPGAFFGTYAPAIHDYFTADRPPPSMTPNAAGKLPTRDPYAEPAMEEAAGYGLAALPFGRAASLGLRGAEAAGARGAMRTLGDFGTSVPMPVRRGVAAGVAGAASLPEMAQAFDTLGPRPTISSDEQAQIDRLNREITGLTNQRTAATKGMGPKGASVQAQAFDSQIGQRNTSIRAIMDQVGARQQAYDERLADFAKKTAPFATREPEWNAALTAAPVASFGSGALLGSLAGRKVAPIKRAMTYGAAGLGGGLEGLIGGYYPTYADLKMPEGSVARTQAQAHEEDPRFWEHGVAPEVGMSAATALLGAKFGMLRREPRVVSQGVAGPATLPELPSRAWATNPDGSRKWPSNPNDPLMKTIDVRPKKGGGFYDANTGHTLPANLWPRQPSGKVVPMHAAEANGGAVRGYWGGGSPFADVPTDELYDSSVEPQYVSDPASIRTNNPGAQWMGPTARQFGASTSEGLSGGNNAAVFPDPQSGAAAQFALWRGNYTGMPLSHAINKWSGGNSPQGYTDFVARQSGLSPNTVLTPEILSSPQGIALMKAQAQWEAGRPYPMTDAQWSEAQSMGMSGSHPMQAAYRNNGVAGGRYGDLVPLSQPQQGGVAPQSGIDWSSNSKLWPALMAAGFGMMASRSPYPLQAIGEGALTGMGAYTKASELESQRAMKQSEIQLQAERLWNQNETERKKLALEAGKFDWTTKQPKTIQTPFGPRSATELPDGTFKDITTGQSYGSNSQVIEPSGGGSPQLTPAQYLTWDSPAVKSGIHSVGTNPSVLEEASRQGVDPGLVKAVAEGRQSLTSVPVRQRPAVEAFLHQYDPEWDQTVYLARQREQNDLSTNGNAGKMILAVNQLWPHLEKASKQAEALDNSDYPAVNSFRNWWITQTGDPRVKQFNTVREVAAMDAARLLRGTGAMAEKDVEFWRDNLANAGSPRQIQNVLADLSDDLMKARVGSIEQGYRTVMKKEPPKFISDEARTALGNVIAQREITNARDRLDNGTPRQEVEESLRSQGIDPARLGSRYAQKGPVKGQTLIKPAPAAAQPAPATAQPAPVEPLPPGAPPDSRRAKDGKIYHPDPDRPGKYMEWTP